MGVTVLTRQFVYDRCRITVKWNRETNYPLVYTIDKEEFHRRLQQKFHNTDEIGSILQILVFLEHYKRIIIKSQTSEFYYGERIQGRTIKHR